ncbi:YeiH family protein [Thalassolituus hydrocarboniclasticus]|uniref:Sulfate exporter family transporter n=1 Tax=Thalassolituus hydrocarboniclasticus TaxID=2742796 RepID=A0ABY6AAF7_9GAMM|nr:putative sulfate exporter family transporter [Thalassolituus hydrocarboniclasticus]UXD87687.1 putative sulfate exporter family transporter [Thalassolituus hydrocarboniclasticus]
MRTDDMPLAAAARRFPRIDGVTANMGHWQGALPTLVLILVLALVCQWLAGLPQLKHWGIGSLPLSILLGILIASTLAPRFLGNATQEYGKGGLRVRRFSQQVLLKAGIVLFGFQLTLDQLWGVGWQALLVDVVTIAAVLSLGIWLGQRWLKLPLRLSILIAIGSAVCGAAAIMATAPLLAERSAAGRGGNTAPDADAATDNQADDPADNAEQQLAIAVALVALFGTLSVLLYPYLCQWFGLDSNSAGLYIGSTVHEVAQAVAATDVLDPATQQNALIVKLLRVALLAPTLLLLGQWLLRRPVADTDKNLQPQTAAAPKRLPVPGFVLGFVAVIVLNSVLPLPLWLTELAAKASVWCLMLAMVALGLNTRWQGMVAAGMKPVLLGLILWLVLLFGGGWLNALLVV